MGMNWAKLAGSLLEGGGKVAVGFGNKQRSQGIQDSFMDLIETEDNPRRKQLLKTIQAGVDTSLAGNMKGIAGMGALTALGQTQTHLFDNDQGMAKMLIQEANQNKRSTEYAGAVSGRNNYNQSQQTLRTLLKERNKAVTEYGPDSEAVAAIDSQLEGLAGVEAGGNSGGGVFNSLSPYNPVAGQ